MKVNMKLQEPIISVEIARLLLEKGFDVPTENGWGTCPSYKGNPLDLDDEMELRDEGVPDSEIVSIDVLYNHWWFPSESDYYLPAPTHGLLHEWLIERWGICILVVPYITWEGVMWSYEIKRLHKDIIEPVCNKAGFDKRSECFEAGVLKVLNDLISF